MSPLERAWRRGRRHRHMSVEGPRETSQMNYVLQTSLFAGSVLVCMLLLLELDHVLVDVRQSMR